MNKEEKFFEDCDKMFKETLKVDKIKILDIRTNKLLADNLYSKVLFDSDLNIYKITEKGVEKVDNENFKAVIV